MQTAAQHIPDSDHEHAERIKRLTGALNRALRDAAQTGLGSDVAIMSVETIGHAVKVPQLIARVAREVEVG
jgi:hypothetical protein